MKFLLALIVPWLIDNADEAVEMIIPALAKEAGIDAGVADLIADTVPAVIRGAQQIAKERPDLTSAEGADLVVSAIRDTLDEADDLPVWGDWTEAERDEFIDDLAGVARGVFRMSREAGGRKGARRGTRQLRRKLRQDLPDLIRARLEAS